MQIPECFESDVVSEGEDRGSQGSGNKTQLDGRVELADGCRGKASRGVRGIKVTDDCTLQG